MKKILIILFFIVPFSSVQGEETWSEKAKSESREVKREAKKKWHRVKEKVCMKDDWECEAQKAKHRAKEAKDATVDGAKDLKEKVD